MAIEYTKRADKKVIVRHNSCMPTLSIKQAARILNISRSKLYTLLDNSEIKSYYIGRRRFITRREISDFISKKEKEGYYE